MTAQQFVFHPSRCTGCEACVLGCWMENRSAQTRPWRQVHTFNGIRHPALPVYHLSLACHHCEHPACLEQCPAKAYTRDPGTGAVTLRQERCMGCRYCTWVCPHDAPKFDPGQGTVEKCTFCASRLEQGLEPACVARCPVDALGIEPRDATRDATRGALPLGLPPSDLGPAIRIVPGLRPAPVATAPPAPSAMARALASLLTVPEAKITLRGEWSLVAFTTTLGVLAGRMIAAAAGRPILHAGWFLGAGAAALALSASHLGRPGRAWRAVLNLRRSWLSREVALVSAFLGLSALALAQPQSRAAGWAAALTGLAALFAVDRVYQVALRAGPFNFHSAHALLNGLYLAGLMASNWPLAALAGALKLALYLQRKGRQGWRAQPLLSLSRLGLGFAVPVLAFGPGLGVAAALAGDLLDRCEYYAELELPTPARCLAQGLRDSV